MRPRLSHALLIFSILFFFLFLLLAASVYSFGSVYNSIVAFDYVVDEALAHLRLIPGVARAMLFATYAGNPVTIIVFETCVLALILLFKRRRVAALFLVGSLFGEGVSLFFKYFIERTRPTETLFHVSRHGYSFPSGHALIAMVFYGTIGFFLAHLSPKRWQKYCIGIVTASIIFFIGFSRVFLGVHWASDVLGGWLLGGAFLAAIIAIFYRIHEHTIEENVGKVTPHEEIGVLAIAAILGFFIVYYVVTHLPELRSIV